MKDRTYRIVVAGRLGQRFADGFDGMSQTHDGSNTVLEGRSADQAQLHGVLDQLRNLGIEIIGFCTKKDAG